MRRKLLVAAVACLALVSMTVGVLGAGGYIGGAPANDADPATETPSTATENDTVAFDGGQPVELEATENATVSGTTELDPGTELSVRVQSADDADPQFFKSVSTTVEDDGTFTATVDLSQFTTERAVKVSVRSDAATAETRGRIVAPEDGFSEPTEEADSAPVSFEGDGSPTLAATGNATLSGTTEADPGSEITVRIRNADEGTAFLKSRAATVGEDGSFTVTYDLSDIYEQREIAVTVAGDDWRHETAGQVVAPDGGFPDADGVEAAFDGDEPLELAAAENQTVAGSTNLETGTEVSVRLHAPDDGRLLAAEETTVGGDGEFTATLDLSRLDAEQDVSVELVVYRETVATADGRVVDRSA